jgi:HWE histidine kinase
MEVQAHLAEMTIPIRTKDSGERLWSFVYSALAAQSGGRRLFVAIAYDVTDRKTYEDQIPFLMREINHRAKNMLSLVQAIARQTAAREPGFGSTVVNSMAKLSVRGEVKLDYAPSGLMWRLSCSAVNALDGGRPLSSPSRAEPVMSRVEARYVT